MSSSEAPKPKARARLSLDEKRFTILQAVERLGGKSLTADVIARQIGRDHVNVRDSLVGLLTDGLIDRARRWKGHGWSMNEAGRIYLEATRRERVTEGEKTVGRLD